MIDNLKKTSVKFGERYPLDELVHGKVFRSVSYEACLPSDRSCQEGLSASCLAVNEWILRPVNEGAVHKFEQHLLVQDPLLRADDIFHNGFIAQFAGLQVHLSPLAVPVLLFGFGKPCHECVQS